MSVNKFKVGDVVKCVDAGIFNNLTAGKEYVLLDVSDGGELMVENDKGDCFYYYSRRFEYEPVKLKGSDLAKKLLKDNPQTCYVSDVSEEYASSKGCVDLIVKFDGVGFVSKSGVIWNNAIPCDKHGEVLDDN